ncbi:MAG: hypothetical protein SynsKO_34400 [Synoicihabitans sp.]
MASAERAGTLAGTPSRAMSSAKNPKSKTITRFTSEAITRRVGLAAIGVETDMSEITPHPERERVNDPKCKKLTSKRTAHHW